MDKVVKRVKAKYTLLKERDQTNREEAMFDFKFATVPGNQWTDLQKTERGSRPTYEFNRIRVNGKKIINEIRQMRPSGKVRPVEGGDKDGAELREGIIRNIWNRSKGDSVVDYAAEYQAYAGRGAWRINVDYADDDSFYQDIMVEKIENPFTLYMDDECAIITDRIPIEEYEERWPKAKKISFEESEFDDDQDYQEDTITIAEAWYVKPSTKTLILLKDGSVVDDESDEGKAILAQPELYERTREVKSKDIYSCIINGVEKLEEETKWAGKYIPFVEVYGEKLNVDGQLTWYGITRWSKDAQRSYNYTRTSISESIAMAPQAKYWVTPTQADGNIESWKDAHKENIPFMVYNNDPQAPGPPLRVGGADVPVALIQEMQIASKEVDDVTGIYADDRGQDSASQSGRAIYARQQQGRISTFNYIDNMSEAVQRTWDILLDLIPKIYDTERELRILGGDDAEKYVSVNKFVLGPEGRPIKINDLSAGKYDVTVTPGQSFSTRRQEASEIYSDMAVQNPNIMPIAGDLIFKSMDLPYADEISERLKALLPPEIKQMVENDDVPPEVQQAMMQAQQAMEMVQQRMQEVEQAAGEVAKQQSDAEKAKFDVEKAISQLKIEEAQFETKVAKELARLTEKTSKATMQETELEYLKGEIVTTIDRSMDDKEMKAQEEQKMIQAVEETKENIYNEINSIYTILEKVMLQLNKPKVIRVDAVRQNGKLMAIPVYETEPGSSGAENPNEANT